MTVIPNTAAIMKLVNPMLFSKAMICTSVMPAASAMATIAAATPCGVQTVDGTGRAPATVAEALLSASHVW